MGTTSDLEYPWGVLELEFFESIDCTGPKLGGQPFGSPGTLGNGLLNAFDNDTETMYEANEPYAGIFIGKIINGGKRVSSIRIASPAFKQEAPSLIVETSEDGKLYILVREINELEVSKQLGGHCFKASPIGSKLVKITRVDFGTPENTQIESCKDAKLEYQDPTGMWITAAQLSPGKETRVNAPYAVNWRVSNSKDRRRLESGPQDSEVSSAGFKLRIGGLDFKAFEKSELAKQAT